VRVNLVQRFAALLGLGIVSFAHADFGQNTGANYVPPSKWSNFNAPTLLPGVTSEALTQQSAYSDRLTAVKPVAPIAKSGSSTPIDSFGAQPLFADSTEVRPASGRSTTGNVTRTSTGPMAPAPHYEDGYTVVAPGHTDSHPLQHMQPQPYAQPAPMQSPYMEAMSAPWSDCGPGPSCVAPAPTRLPLKPWFGGANVLLWNMADNGYQRFLFDDVDTRVTRASNADIAPDFGAGYEVFAGRYLGCGRYGLSVGYFNFNPGNQDFSIAPAVGGGYRAAMPQYNNILMDHDGVGGTPGVSVYDLLDGADSFRIQRNVGFQGLEANVSCFGIMGARRLAPLCGDGYGRGPISRMKQCLGMGQYGTTGAGGALASPCGGCAQVVMSHGVRWFQFNDDFLFSSFDADYAPTPGVPVNMMHEIDVENNLYGYQFGGRLTYCLTRRLVANIGARGGLYGNDVSVQQRIGNGTDFAYPATMPLSPMNINASDVVLSGLGELDLGLGYRLNNCWTLNGGYRVLYATGVATSLGSISNDYLSTGPASRVYADDSVLLHGAYVGASMNW